MSSPHPDLESAPTARRLIGSERLPLLIVLMGVLLRLAQYLSNRSLWLDECSLAPSIIGRSFGGLLQPLDYGQGAPIGFLFLSKAATLAFGNNEYALRLVPLASGIAALLLFWAVARRVVGARALPLALLLFAVSDRLIYQSTEFKQYSGDVAVGLLIYWLAFPPRMEALTRGRAALLAVVGAAAVWFSHASVFVLAGVGIALGISSLHARDWRRLGYLSGIGLCWLASFAVAYFVSFRQLLANEHLLEFWHDAFMPFPPSSVEDAKWFLKTAFQVLKRPGGFELSGLAAFAFALGCWSLFVRDRLRFLSLLLPILLVLLASGLRRYPFYGRFLLFAVPAMVLLVAEGVDYVRARVTNGRLIPVALALLLLLHPLLLAGYHLVRPRTREEIKPVLSYVQRRHQPGDVLYVYYHALRSFDYYRPQFGFEDVTVVKGVSGLRDWNAYRRDLQKLSGEGRVWVVFSHIVDWLGVDEERLLVSYLDAMGRRLDAYHAPGAAAYLYDLRSPPSDDAPAAE